MREKREPAANLLYENQLRACGYERIVGIDEAGRGPWAGPVAAAAVCLPLDDKRRMKPLAGVRDSKQMTAAARVEMAFAIQSVALAWGIGSATSMEIDTLGLIPATQLAIGRALGVLAADFPHFQPQCLFLDALLLPESIAKIPQVVMIHGDARSVSIAAASVLAKVWRDARMTELDAEFPEYGFAEHKGYGTPQHSAALREHGPCPQHRLSFKPVREVLRADT